jgi:Na+-translocating ferredoxin:NAD+ oxidoreductase RnfG subunit
MRNIIYWVVPPALVAGAPCPTWAVTYLTVEQAQQAIFPQAKLRKLEVTMTAEQRKAIEKASGVRVRQTKPEVWQADTGGWFFVDEVVGKHEFIVYAVGLDSTGAVKQIEILDYRETYGGQVRQAEWRAQFVGKKYGARLKLDDDIKNVSGATLSCRHVTDGVKRLLATHEILFKK